MAKNEKAKPEPKIKWVCLKCGLTYGRNLRPDRLATFHMGQCDVCGEETSVTEPRDFGGMREIREKK